MSRGTCSFIGACRDLGTWGAIAIGALGCIHPCMADATIIARTGQLASTSEPAQLRHFLINNTTVQLPPPMLNDSGTVLFYASLQGPGTSGSTDDGVWMNAPQGRLTVMRQGDAAPGPDGGTYFWGAVSVHLAQDDSVFLRAIMTGAGVLPGINDLGVWRISAAGSDRIARMGDTAPGTASLGTYRALSPLIISTGSGPADVVLPGQVCRNNCVSQTDGLWMPASEDPLRIEQGAIAPGTAGATFASFQSLSSGQGTALYLGQLTGGDVQSIVIGGNTLSNATGIWRDTGMGSPQLRVRAMTPLTADPNGPVIGAIHDASRAPIQTSSGDVLFSATRYNRSTGAYLGHGLYRRSSAITPVAVTGDAISSFSGVSFASVGTSNTSRTIWPLGSGVMFVGVLSGSGVTTSNNQSIVLSGTSGLSSLARGGSQAAGCAVGQTYMNSTLADSLQVSPAGAYAFAARLQGTGVTSANCRAIWTGSDGTLSLALRQGMTIGGFSVYDFTNSGRDFQLNDAGQLVVEANVVEVGDPWNTRYRAIIGYTPSTGAELLAVVGQSLQTPEGATPTLMSFRLGTSGSLNNSGQVAFAVKFNSAAEDEGVVITSLGGVAPCPADYDGSGALTTADIYAFLTDWFSGNADYDHSGTTEVVDIFTFITDWYRGCP